MKNKNGSVLIAAVIALAAAGVALLVGNSIADKSSYPDSAIASPLTLATYHNQNFGFSFHYPNNWIITETNSETLPYYISIQSPSQFTISAVTTDNAPSGGCENDEKFDMGHEKITINDIPLNIFYFGDKSKDTIIKAYVLTSDTPCPNMDYIQIPSIPAGSPEFTRIEMYYGNMKEMRSSDFKNGDFQTAKSLISTFTKD